MLDSISFCAFHFHKKPKGHAKGTDDIWYWAYVDANFGGASIFADLPQGWIYWRTPYVGDAMNEELMLLQEALG